MQPVSPVLQLDPLQAARLRIHGIREVTFAKDQPEYQPLPAVRLDDGVVISRWALSWRERLRVLFGGSVWLQLSTFGKPLQPVLVTAEQPSIAVGDNVL